MGSANCHNGNGVLNKRRSAPRAQKWRLQLSLTPTCGAICIKTQVRRWCSDGAIGCMHTGAATLSGDGLTVTVEGKMGRVRRTLGHDS